MFVQSIIRIIIRFALFFGIFILLGYLFFYCALRQKKGQEKNGSLRQKIMGLLMELDNFSVLAISVSCIRFVFLVYALCYRSDLANIHLYALLLLSLLFGIFSKSIKNFIIDLGSSFALYVALFSSRLLSNYLLEIRYVWYISLGNILLILFIAFYIVYFYLRSINDVVSRTKYIRRFRNEEH